MLFAGAGLTAVNFVNILFSILIGQFLSLNPLLNAGGRHEIGGILKASILSSVVLRKHGIFRVSSIRSLDFIDDLFDVWWRWVGKCESFSIPIFILQPVLSYFPSFFISIYNKDITRAVIGGKSVLYGSMEHRAELQLSRHLPNWTMSALLRDFSLAFFVHWKWNFETSEPASSNRTTKQRFINMPGAVIDVIITWAETKILKEETKWTWLQAYLE